MNRDDLFKSFTGIDDQTLIDTETNQKRKGNPIVFKLIAASLALALIAFGASSLFPTDNPAKSAWFVITAQAAGEDMQELGMNEGYFNSGGTGHNIFGNDEPLFDFSIEPAKWDNNEAIYHYFDISISYAGKNVGAGDDHVGVYYSYPVPGSHAPYGCGVCGWFDEATDITITITDIRTGDLVEEIVVNVVPVQDASGYQLTVTSVKTNNSTE